jgi:hypothetical protein
MLYFLLPHNYSLIYNYLALTTTQNQNEDLIKPSLQTYLTKIKERIPLDWDCYKKYTNPYEFIHTHIPKTPQRKYSDCVSKMHPLSRSFFKLVEIYNIFQFKFPNQEIKTFHLAEGPGGFIEALVFLRENKNDK